MTGFVGGAEQRIEGSYRRFITIFHLGRTVKHFTSSAPIILVIMVPQFSLVLPDLFPHLCEDRSCQIHSLEDIKEKQL